jgi:hypothetical protein
MPGMKTKRGGAENAEVLADGQLFSQPDSAFSAPQRLSETSDLFLSVVKKFPRAACALAGGGGGAKRGLAFCSSVAQLFKLK